VNQGTNTSVLKINGVTVGYTSVTNGNEVTITYTPAAALSGQVTAQVTYAGAVGTWAYQIRTGQKALFVTGSGSPNSSESFIANRLAQNFGLDVEFAAQSAIAADTTLSLATNKTMIMISSTVSGGNIAAWARRFMTNNQTASVIYWEAANGDDWAFGSDGAGNGAQSLAIVNAPNPLTAGLTNGTHAVYESGFSDGQRFSNPIAGLIIAANNLNALPDPKIAGMDKGLVINNIYSSGIDVSNASRKVFLGLLGNNNAEHLNENGLALFDAAVTWVLPPAAPKLTVAPGPGAGEMIVGWTGAGTLETATNLLTPTWISAPSQANPQTVPTTGTQRYYRIKQ
jgi:hypothetical protein